MKFTKEKLKKVDKMVNDLCFIILTIKEILNSLTFYYLMKCKNKTYKLFI